MDVVTSSAQAGVLGNLKRKQVACEGMFEQLVAHMNNAVNINRMSQFGTKQELPKWL